MTKPYGMFFSDVSGVGPELYDADTDRDIGYLYANPDADRIAKQWAHTPLLMEQVQALLLATVVTKVGDFEGEWQAVFDTLVAMEYQP